MSQRTVLDAAAFDVLDTAKGDKLRVLMRRTLARGGEICCAADAALVLTSDPDDIATLAVAVPGTRVVIRDPAAL